MSEYIYMPQGIDALRAEMYTVRKNQFRRLYEQCALYQQESLPLEHPMKSITYFAMAASNLCLAYKLTGERHYLEEAKRWIFTGVDYPHWGRAVKVDVDLSASWLLFGFGLCYNWIAADLSGEERKKLLDKLILQGERMYAYSCEHRDGEWPVSYWQNHNWIDYTGLAMAGYAIRAEYPAAQKWIDSAREDIVFALSLLAEDGSDYEGVVYWRYGVIWLAQYATLLREQEGIDLFQDSAFLKNTFFYRLYQCAPDLAQNFNFGDCHDKRSGHTIALYYKLASEYQNGYAQWLAEEVRTKMLWREAYESGIKPGILPEAFLEFLWYNPNIEKREIQDLPTDAFFEDLGLYSHRTGWNASAQALSYKCASGGGQKQWALSCEMEQTQKCKIRSMGHHHPDSNSFILINGNDYMIVDEGYSSSKMSAHHNIVLVDGKGYEYDGTKDVHCALTAERTAAVQEYTQHQNYTYICGEAAPVYHKECALTSCKRELLCIANRFYVVCDTLQSEQAHQYSMLLQFETPPQLTESGCIVHNGESRLQVYNAAVDASCRADTTSVSANPTTQEPSLIITHTMHTLFIENKQPSAHFTFLTVLCAQYLTEPEMHFEVRHTAWGSVLCITANDFSSIVIYNPSQISIEETICISKREVSIHTHCKWTVL